MFAFVFLNITWNKFSGWLCLTNSFAERMLLFLRLLGSFRIVQLHSFCILRPCLLFASRHFNAFQEGEETAEGEPSEG